MMRGRAASRELWETVQRYSGGWRHRAAFRFRGGAERWRRKAASTFWGGAFIPGRSTLMVRATGLRGVLGAMVLAMCLVPASVTHAQAPAPAHAPGAGTPAAMP